MDINRVFTDYGYDKVDLDTLPDSLKNYIMAMQSVESGMIPSLISDLHASAAHTGSLIDGLKAELGAEALNTLATYIRVATREMIITVVDRMNADAARTSADIHPEETEGPES